jgi:hypothetical protein
MQSVFTFNIKISLFIRVTNLVEVALPSEHSEGMVPPFVQSVQAMGNVPKCHGQKKCAGPKMMVLAHEDQIHRKG